MINASYQRDMAIALPGMVSDTSKYNIDAACVLTGENDVKVGLLVQVDSSQPAEGHKLMKPMKKGGKPYGIAIRSHFQTVGKDGSMVYEAGGAINVMSAGRCWALSKSTEAPQFGAPATFDAEGYEVKDGEVKPEGWTYAGGFTKFQDLVLVEIQLKQF